MTAINKHLEDPEIEKRIIAAAALNTIDPDSSNIAKKLLIDALQSTDEKIISVALFKAVSMVFTIV